MKTVRAIVSLAVLGALLVAAATGAVQSFKNDAFALLTSGASPYGVTDLDISATKTSWWNPVYGGTWEVEASGLHVSSTSELIGAIEVEANLELSYSDEIARDSDDDFHFMSSVAFTTTTATIGEGKGTELMGVSATAESDHTFWDPQFPGGRVELNTSIEGTL